MFTARLIFKLLPWILIIMVAGFLWIRYMASSAQEEIRIQHQTLLREVEELGKLELVKYRMKDIIEIDKFSKRYLDLGLFRIQKGSDAKAVLIASGEAVACIDLLKIGSEDIIGGDTVTITLPSPELCYYKIDHQNSRLFNLEKGTLMSNAEFNKFIDTAYAEAEVQMMRAALDAGILKEAEAMAYKMLEPLLQRIAGKPVILNFKQEGLSTRDKVDLR